MNYKKVIWSEGLFINPQHFQQSERYLESYINSYSKFHRADLWGVTELKLDTSLLDIGKIGVKRAAGIFPDGTPFELNQGLMIDIINAAHNKLLYLALPIARVGICEIGDNGSSARYCYQQQQAYDMTLSTGDSVPIDVAEPNVTLKIEGENLKDYSLIPVAKIKSSKQDSKVEINLAFIAPCIYYGISDFITENIKELHAQLQFRAKAISQRIGSLTNLQSNHTLLNDYLWLQFLGRWLSIVNQWLESPSFHPKDIYYQLQVMLGEMCGLEGRIIQVYEPWRVEDIYKCYASLFSELRVMLNEVRVSTVTAIEWDDSLFEKRRLMRAQVKDSRLYNGSRFILSISSHIGTAKLSQYFTQLATLSGQSRIANLVHDGLSGVPLRLLSGAPVELKAKPDTLYFEIDTQSTLWLEIVQRDEPVALHVDNKLDDVEVFLYAVR